MHNLVFDPVACSALCALALVASGCARTESTPTPEGPTTEERTTTAAVTATAEAAPSATTAATRASALPDCDIIDLTKPMPTDCQVPSGGMLGLTGIGEGGGGRGEGIGLGSATADSPNGCPEKDRKVSVRQGAISVSGKLPEEVIIRIIKQNLGRFRLCYEAGLKANPNLLGRVTVSFTIGSDGSVGSVSGGGDLPDGGVIGCVTKTFYGLSFPQPEEGVVKVSYPIAFACSGAEGAP